MVEDRGTGLEGDGLDARVHDVRVGVVTGREGAVADDAVLRGEKDPVPVVEEA